MIGPPILVVPAQPESSKQDIYRWPVDPGLRRDDRCLSFLHGVIRIYDRAENLNENYLVITTFGTDLVLFSPGWRN